MRIFDKSSARSKALEAKKGKTETEGHRAKREYKEDSSFDRAFKNRGLK